MEHTFRGFLCVMKFGLCHCLDRVRNHTALRRTAVRPPLCRAGNGRECSAACRRRSDAASAAAIERGSSRCKLCWCRNDPAFNRCAHLSSPPTRMLCALSLGLAHFCYEAQCRRAFSFLQALGSLFLFGFSAMGILDDETIMKDAPWFKLERPSGEGAPLRLSSGANIAFFLFVCAGG